MAVTLISMVGHARLLGRQPADPVRVSGGQGRARSPPTPRRCSRSSPRDLRWSTRLRLGHGLPGRRGLRPGQRPRRRAPTSRSPGSTVGKVDGDRARRRRAARTSTLEIDDDYRARARARSPIRAALGGGPGQPLRRARARATATELDDGATLGLARTDQPVEVDQVLSTLDARDARATCERALAGLARATDGEGADLRDSLAHSAEALGNDAPTSLARSRSDGEALRDARSTAAARSSRRSPATATASPRPPSGCAARARGQRRARRRSSSALRRALPAGLSAPRQALERLDGSIADPARPRRRRRPGGRRARARSARRCARRSPQARPALARGGRPRRRRAGAAAGPAAAARRRAADADGPRPGAALGRADPRRGARPDARLLLVLLQLGRLHLGLRRQRPRGARRPRAAAGARQRDRPAPTTAPGQLEAPFVRTPGRPGGRAVGELPRLASSAEAGE